MNKLNIRSLLFLFASLAMLPSMVQAKAKASPDTITARTAFTNLPPTEIDLLSKSSRLDMLDYYDATAKGAALNQRLGISILDTLTNDYALVEVTPVSTLQLKVLEDKKGNDIVLSIYTTGAENEAQDSEITVYDSKMNRLDANKYVMLPQLKDFFEIPKGSLTKMKEIEQLIPFYTVKYTAKPGSGDVTAELTIGEIVNIEDFRIVELFKKPSVTLHWDGKKLR